MRIAYLDCASGISGDMTLAALVDAGVDLAQIQAGIDSLGLPGCRIVASEVKRKGFRATHITVEYPPEHAHRHLHHITAMIDRSRLTERQKDLARRIFTRLGEAEAKVHGTTIEKVHFHEVGAVDSIADIVGAAIGWDLLGADRILASPIPTGHGFVTIAHGRCSIPAPATAELLTGVPLAASEVEAELTTPTGAAIAATLVESFGPVPPMRIERIGCGAGTRELTEQPNILRLMVGAAADESAALEQIWIVETNLDDASGELIGYCTSRLWEVGALDVYTTAIQMKKNRPGVVLSVICNAADIERIEAVLFRETTTLGVRRWPAGRRKLDRRRHEVTTPWGQVDGVLALLPGHPPTFSPEYETCRRIADERNVPLRIIIEAAQRAFEPGAIQ
jgi:pyridinium-3,5-bisthiocarboxylic acid mononucleotide nickel chelatase